LFHVKTSRFLEIALVLVRFDHIASFSETAHNRRVKPWEIIADRLSAAGWSWGCVSTINFNGQTIWIVDAHRDVCCAHIISSLLCGEQKRHNRRVKYWKIISDKAQQSE
jgi:hypothetical protein